MGVVGDLVLVFQTELTAYVGKAPFLVQLVQAALRPPETGLFGSFRRRSVQTAFAGARIQSCCRVRSGYKACS